MMSPFCRNTHQNISDHVLMISRTRVSGVHRATNRNPTTVNKVAIKPGQISDQEKFLSWLAISMIHAMLAAIITESFHLP